MKMERCLGRWLKGPLFLFELQSEVVMRNRLVLLAALMWCLSGVAAAAPAMDIVLYPSSAQVQVDDTLPVKNGAVAFVVPAGTDLESLVISGPQRSLSLRQRQKVQEVLRREREIVKAVLGRGECSEKGSPFLKIASEGTALPPQGFCRGSLCGD